MLVDSAQRYLDVTPPQKNCPFPLERDTPSNIWFLEPTPVYIPNCISIGLLVFAGLTSVNNTHAQIQTTLRL